jgi:hypothetical protein
VAEVNVTVTVDAPNGTMTLNVALLDSNGQNIFQNAYALLV